MVGRINRLDMQHTYFDVWSMRSQASEDGKEGRWDIGSILVVEVCCRGRDVLIAVRTERGGS